MSWKLILIDKTRYPEIGLNTSYIQIYIYRYCIGYKTYFSLKKYDIEAI